MPIAFHDAHSVESLGFAAFFHIEWRDPNAYGALFLINARGEPQEFVFNRLEPTHAALWRESDRIGGAARRLCASLFPAAALAPALLLLRAENVSPAFLEGIELEIPVGALGLCAETDEWAFSTWDGQGEVCFVRAQWQAAPPTGALFGLLHERGLLLEPFERAAKGLREVFEELE